MQELFARTLSEALQAFIPVVVCLTWLRHSGRVANRSAVRLGLLVAIPVTAMAAWLFGASAYQARWESLMAIGAIGIVAAIGSNLWSRAAVDETNGGEHPRPMTSQIGLAAATVLIVVRQTMLIAVVFVAAALQIRSFDATVAVVGATGLALAVAGGCVVAGNRLPQRAALNAARAFTVLFLAQVAFYAIHKSAEARFLPWSELLDEATEPYGPDSIFGRYVSDLLVGLPIVVAGLSVTRGRAGSVRRWRPSLVLAGSAAVAASAIIIVAAGIVLAGWARPSGMPRTNEAGAAAPAIELTSMAAAPHLLFLSKQIDANYAVLSVAPLQAPTAGRAPAVLHCERVSFAGRQGICLQADRGVFTTYRAVLLDERFQSRMSWKLEGSPSRTRVSADGRVGAITVFVTGQAHGYAGAAFSTRTTLVDMASGDVLGDLEQFATWRDGKRISAADFNFWGVTFARDSNTFYATLQTAGKTYLVRGDLGLRKLTIVHENVECPSLSPDNRLIAYKKKVGGTLSPWRFYVLDLATLSEKPIAAEPRSIDDQIEWLDDAHVLYGAPRSSQSAIVDVYVASIDGKEPARVFLPAAESPIVVR